MTPLATSGTTLAITRGAEAQFSTDEIATCFARHIKGDWGDVVADQVRQNEEYLQDRGMIHSVYRVGDRTMWVITDPGWEITTVLLPDEY